MTGTKSLFGRLLQLSNIRSVAIANSRTCPVSGEGVVHVSSQITLENVVSSSFQSIYFPLVS